MLRAECFKQRLEKGLSFLEFNYMLMQSYDFLVLARKYDCKMQFGGNDQWSNIISGVDLNRREDSKQVYGMTFSLLTTSEGVKMGKTVKGALWLDAAKTSPYEFYQYWRNVEDADVRKCLCMLTFLPMEEVERLSSLEGENINKAKEVLAYEVTKLVHGSEEADKARDGARAAFGGGGGLENIPSTQIPASEFDGEGVGIVSLIHKIGLVPSKGEGFRTIEQGGLTVDDVKVTDTKLMITKESFKDGRLIIKKGKKTFHMVELE
jgi:tyrosyl-tRNA synthetase